MFGAALHLRPLPMHRALQLAILKLTKTEALNPNPEVDP